MQSKSCGCEKKQSAKVTQIVKGARTKKKKTVQELWEKQTRNENIRKYEQKKSNFLKKNQMDSRDEK